ncbi:MAG TPA: tRNA uridine-5-carboxymethylaminomethyl(34) synthesis GTPase MnmE, partial [Gammaproteobacteria bacterium]|nr:tRNA uridine-5-carboxymethylaminomethyl(34) synthesis GTPase MnmE [Gammaproteobacteria bacterium]
MSHDATDTIAAIATPPGRGGIGIVRVSGPQAATIAQAITGQLPSPRQAVFSQFKDTQQQLLDEGLVLYFPAPHSFTGEDVVELQGHGGPVVLDILLQTILAHGVRQARPGEFSERAFLNNKLDLVQAEAIADLIDSGSALAARAALRSLQGDFSHAVEALDKAIIALRTYVEAAIDFPDEDVEFLAAPEVHQRIDTIQQQFQELENRAQQGAMLRDGLTLVIAGQPNAGKSSLLNALAGYEAAIVTDIPGTTRDVLRERILLDGIPLHIIDTAGLRDSGDTIEREGVARARAEISRANAVLLIIDATKGWQAEDKAILDAIDSALSVIVVFNKTDLTNGFLPPLLAWERGSPYPPKTLNLSALTGTGLDTLRQELRTITGVQHSNTDTFSAR